MDRRGIILLGLALVLGVPGNAKGQFEPFNWFTDRGDMSWPHNNLVEVQFTLSGTLDLTLYAMEVGPDAVEMVPSQAVVECWICEEGSCHAEEENPYNYRTSPFGPARAFIDVEPHAVQGVPQQASFEVRFGDLESVRQGEVTELPPVNPANINSYYCRVGFGAKLVGSAGGTGPLITPSFYHPEDQILRLLKAQDGTPLVVELTGTIN